MRVLHVDSAATWRGGQNQVLLSARGMAARGHDVLLACRAGGMLESRARDQGVAVAPLGFRGDLAPGALLGLRHLARHFRPDVIHLHDPHAVAAGLLPGTDGLRVASRRVDFPLRGALSRWKYARCRRVIAVSRAVAEVLARDGLDPDRVRVVYEGVADRAPAAGGREALRALGVPDGAPVVGNVAALTDHKDHATLLAAAGELVRRLPEARIVIVGEGERRPALEKTIAATGLAAHVLLAGFRTDLDALIPAFDVFCLSSQMEGLGTSLLDAMCFARPVVATAAGGIPEAVEDGVTGVVVPRQDPHALAEALLRVLSDPVARERMGRAARERFLARFSADRMVEATLAVYAEGA
ncbi:MAG TPA: glycosyltransferase [Vicinamibacteria bacterium]|nr:glycosyltransferase [Vicinamibacteria bacterium]